MATRRTIGSPDKLVGSLSGGQKQAVAIARAVHVNRTLLILDEPRSALASRATEPLFTYLRSLRDWNITSILVTHDPFDAYRVCDRFVVIARGEKVFEKTRAETSVDELIEKVSHG
jgi:simple sugar transport system ATP-binding protein